MKKLIPPMVVLLIGCSAAPLELGDAGSEAAAECHPTASECAHCCEVQPYVNETQAGKMYVEPISACTSTPLPDVWSVDWCMADCESICAP